MNAYRANLKNGFTLLETVVALAILTAAIVGPMSLVSSGIASGRASKNLTIASYLAEEGMEIVRGIKENNALAGRTNTSGNCSQSDNWDYGLCTGAWQAYISDPLPPLEWNGLSLELDDGSPLRFDPGNPGLYSHTSGSPTIFTRRVDISKPSGAETDTVEAPPLIIPPSDILDVVVTVSWREGLAGTREVVLRERFYNWQ